MSSRDDFNSRDFIDIEGLTVRTIVGIFEHERVSRQAVNLDLRLATDVRRAAEGDDIEQALDYKKVTKRVLELVEDSSFFLVETLAERIAEVILTEFDCPLVRVRVQKPGALRYARTVGITITRARSEAQ